MNWAEEILSDLFPNMWWGEIVETAPEDTETTASYLNRAAVVETDMGFEDIKTLFKNIERKCGRTPEGKQKGIIPLDIDLLVFDMEVVKPADMEKNYVKQALNTLSEQVDYTSFIYPSRV
jgi:7,8-dihydro-6-hydroxymethylpterin-pyrophosphokinase (HPPK)